MYHKKVIIYPRTIQISAQSELLSPSSSGLSNTKCMLVFSLFLMFRKSDRYLTIGGIADVVQDQHMKAVHKTTIMDILSLSWLIKSCVRGTHQLAARPRWHDILTQMHKCLLFPNTNIFHVHPIAGCNCGHLLPRRRRRQPRSPRW